MDTDDIRTPRLLLKQLRSNNVGTRDLEWFHRVWSNEQATQWSYHGPCKTSEESREWMAGVLPRNAAGSKIQIAYAVLCKGFDSPTAPPDGDNDWEAAGILTLLSTNVSSQSATRDSSKSPCTAVELGYLFHPTSWGKGYATESIRELLRAYRDERAASRPNEAVKIYGTVHGENVRSLRVMQKLGFEEVGRYEREGRLPLRDTVRKDTIIHFRMKLPEEEIPRHGGLLQDC